VGKLLNLIKYCVGLFSLLFLCSYRVGTSPLHLSLLVDSSLVVVSCSTSGIRASQVRRGIVCRFQEHLLLFGRDRVSISEQHWDCLWDHVSISKQRLNCLRNQFGGVNRFEKSSKVHFEVKILSLSSVLI